jgi:hypothetical protein
VLVAGTNLPSLRTLLSPGLKNMKKIIRIAAVAIASAATCGAAPALELAPRKPGLWHIIMATPGGKIPPRDMQMCIDADTDAAMGKLGATAQGRPLAARSACVEEDPALSGYRRRL